MTDHRSARLDLAGLLAAVEDAPPVAAADVLGERLTDALGASDVSFLIADFSGRAPIRLDHVGSEAAARARAARPPSACPWPGHRMVARSRARRSRSRTAPPVLACLRR